MAYHQPLDIPSFPYIKTIEAFTPSPPSSEHEGHPFSKTTLINQSSNTTISDDPLNSSSSLSPMSTSTTSSSTPPPPKARIDTTRRNLYTRHAAIVDALSNSQEEFEEAEKRLLESEAYAQALTQEAKLAYDEKKRLEKQAKRLEKLTQSYSGPLASFFNSNHSEKKDQLEKEYNTIIQHLKKAKRNATFKADDARTALCTVVYNEEQRDALLIDFKSWQNSKSTLRNILKFVYEGEETGDEEENIMEKKWQSAQEKFHIALRESDLHENALIRLEEASTKLEHARKYFTIVFSRKNIIFGDVENAVKSIKAMKKALDAISEAIDINEDLDVAKLKNDVISTKTTIEKMITDQSTGKDLSRAHLKSIYHKIDLFKESVEDSIAVQQDCVSEKHSILQGLEDKYDDLTEQLAAIRKRLMEEALRYYETHPNVSG